jgi:hypothetical protein
MDTGDKYKNGPPTSNIPATAQAFVAPKVGPPSPVAQTNGKPKWGATEICPRCGKGLILIFTRMTVRLKGSYNFNF